MKTFTKTFTKTITKTFVKTLTKKKKSVPTSIITNGNIGDQCHTLNDCNDAWICTGGICAIDPTVSTTGVPAISTGIPITSGNASIPIVSGNSAVVTNFDDQTFQCISGSPTGNAMAVNPLLLGFTTTEWTNLYANADPNAIPWCNREMTVIVNGHTFVGTIIDTCSPTNTQFIDPISGKIIGGKCGYDLDIDLYGQPGLDFLNLISNGDNFFDGTNGGVSWSII